MARSTHKFLIQNAHRTEACFRIVFAGGRTWQSREGEPAFTLVFRNRRAERRVMLFGMSACWNRISPGTWMLTAACNWLSAPAWTWGWTSPLPIC
jgi:hypothetical protein